MPWSISHFKHEVVGIKRNKKILYFEYQNSFAESELCHSFQVDDSMMACNIFPDQNW